MVLVPGRLKGATSSFGTSQGRQLGKEGVAEYPRLEGEEIRVRLEVALRYVQNHHLVSARGQ
eukprot:246017-Rhodomonas_salina.1